jgi:phytol kinase
MHKLNDILIAIFDFFYTNIPPFSFIAWFLPLSFCFAFFALFIAGWLKKNNHWRTGYSRKLFHFIIFFSASAIQLKYALGGLFVFGWGVSAVLIYAILRGKNNILYEAIAREKDEPKQTYFIIIPYFATLFGGLASNYFFPPICAMAGYLVTGLADAIAEPIGTKWGKHKYKVPSLSAVVSYRSFEGSLAVFMASVSCIFLSTFLANKMGIDFVILKIVFIALILTILEAVSPHGWDNFTTQFGGALLFYLLIWNVLA